jgi:arylformamidase
MKFAFDISPLISERIAVFPGDEPYIRKTSRDFQSHNIGLSSIHSTVHLGAHVDAPNHYSPNGVGIDQVNLSYYFGDCQVIHLPVRHPDCRLTVADFQQQTITAPRVLIATHSFLNPDHWVDDFMALSPEVIDFLATHHVRLVGIDTPSVDPAQAKQLITHEAVARHKMAILEGLVLHHVPAGNYQLMALPLKLKDADASPVRAVLFEKG